MKISDKILVDVDTGIDDALALVLISKIIKNNFVLTTSGGNCTIEDTTRNTLGILKFLNLQVSVAQGSSKPLMKDRYQNAYDFHGNNGIGNINLPMGGKIEDLNASDFIINYLKSDESKKTILWLSATTNLAQAILKDQTIVDYIDRLILMGGAINVDGNETKFAEFNFFQDPDALKIILDNLGEKIDLIPLDVTNKCSLKIEDLEKIKDSSTGKFVKTVIKNWYGFFGESKNRDFDLYDPLAASLIDKNFMKFKTESFDFFTSGEKQGALQHGKQYKISYAFEVDSRSFVDYFIDKINS